MENESKQRFQIYFAGASIAFGIPFLLGEAIGLIIGASPVSDEFGEWFSILYVVLHLISGLLGGTLVSRRLTTKENLLQAGGITGILAYLLQQLIYVIFYGVGFLGDIYTFAALSLGSIGGAFLYSRFAKPTSSEG